MSMHNPERSAEAHEEETNDTVVVAGDGRGSRIFVGEKSLEDLSPDGIKGETHGTVLDLLPKHGMGIFGPPDDSGISLDSHEPDPWLTPPEWRISRSKEYWARRSSPSGQE